MKKIILNFEKKSKKLKELVQEAFNKDILDFLVSSDTYSEFEKIERVKLYSRNPEIRIKNIICDNRDALQQHLIKQGTIENIGYYKELKSKKDELEIIELSKTGKIDFIIVSAKDWKVIPFENLIAEMHSYDTELIAAVSNINEAELMLKILEIGVDGILIEPIGVNDILELKKLLYLNYKIQLTNAKVINIQNVSESDRVCVDTTSILHPGEGMLVGSTASGFALMHAEVFETKFVASRPFRVNAGDVSAYVLVPSDDPNTPYRTKYLSELQGGDKVLIINKKGDVRIVTVGRVKIETRPMLRFELETFEKEHKININCICQNAETIRLIDSKGNAKSVVDVKIGDELLVHIGPGATHFGTAIKETIIEK
jgi:3-dehydroquinate synthase II